MQKNVYTGLATGPLTKRALKSGIEGGANKQEGVGDRKNKLKLISGGGVINEVRGGRGEGGLNLFKQSP